MSKGCFTVDTTQADNVLLLFYSNSNNSIQCFNSNVVEFCTILSISCLIAPVQIQFDILRCWHNLKKRFYENQWNLRCHCLCIHGNFSHGTKLLMKNFQTHFLGKYIWRDLLLCRISQSDTSDNISFPVRVWLHRFHLTNMNEWIREETRVMCYILHQKSKVQLLFFKALCISGTFLW